MTVTRTFAVLKVSREAYEECARRLREAGHDRVFLDGGLDYQQVIDMHGIALAVRPEDAGERSKEEQCRTPRRT